MSSSSPLIDRAKAQAKRLAILLGATGKSEWQGAGSSSPVVRVVRPLGSMRTRVLHISWAGDGGVDFWEPVSRGELRRLQRVVQCARQASPAAETLTHWDPLRRRRTMIHMETTGELVEVTLSLLHAGGRASRSVQALTVEQLAELG